MPRRSRRALDVRRPAVPRSSQRATTLAPAPTALTSPPEILDHYGKRASGRPPGRAQRPLDINWKPAADPRRLRAEPTIFGRAVSPMPGLEPVRTTPPGEASASRLRVALTLPRWTRQRVLRCPRRELALPARISSNRKTCIRRRAVSSDVNPPRSKVRPTSKADGRPRGHPCFVGSPQRMVVRQCGPLHGSRRARDGTDSCSAG